MKVLFLGHYRDLTGYGNGAIEYMSALDAVGIDVVARPFKLNQSRGPIPDHIQKFEDKSSHGCDAVIQYTLPPYMFANKNFNKNIALFANETYTLGDTNWHRYLNMMDEIWVINQQMVNACINSKVCRDIKLVYHPIDINKLKTPAAPLAIDAIKDKFVFYFIGEFNRRKNIAALLHAFHAEFHRTEPVEVLLKVNVPPQLGNPYEFMRGYCNELKKGLKIYTNLEAYKQEVIIAEYLTEGQMLQLHAACNCLVAPSFGEAWCIPAAEAMALGKTPIVTNTGGLAEVVTNDVGWVVNANQEPCFGMIDTFSDLYTSNDTWDNINILALRKAMREAYKNNILRKKKSIAGIKRGYTYSYQVIGQRLKEALEA